jgi:hypothetical protein
LLASTRNPAEQIPKLPGASCAELGMAIKKQLRLSIAQAIHKANVLGWRQGLAGPYERSNLALVDRDAEVSVGSVNVRLGDQNQAWPLWTPEPAMLLELGDSIEGFSGNVRRVTVAVDSPHARCVCALEEFLCSAVSGAIASVSEDPGGNPSVLDFGGVERKRQQP